MGIVDWQSILRRGTMLRSLLILLLSVSSLSFAEDDFLNIRLDPSMLFTQSVHIGLDFELAEQWSLGPYVRAHAVEPLYSYGVRLAYYEQDTFKSGWFSALDIGLQQTAPHIDGDEAYWNSEQESYCLDKGVYDPNADSYVEDLQCQKAASSTEAVLSHNYLWRKRNFNVGLGAAATFSYNPDAESSFDYGSRLNLSIGWVR
jgi:hypothetical protein